MLEFKLADIIRVPFSYVLRFFNQICGNHYILALLLFGLLIKILTLPLSIKQQKNQIKGAMLRPKMVMIEKKYKDKNDPESLRKKQAEMMEMQQREGYSPFAGCLPLLIQMPILISLYNIIRAPLTYIAQVSNDAVAKIYNLMNAGVSGFAPIAETNVVWKDIKNLDQIKMLDYVRQNPGLVSDTQYQALPNLELFGGAINLGEVPKLAFWNATGANGWLIFVPIFTLVFAIITMKLTKKFSGNLQAELVGQTPEQQKSSAIMEWMMPVMSTWISFMVSAALGVYWMFNSILGLIQMVILNKLMPMPKFTDEEIRAMIKEMKSKPKPRQFDENNPRPRSLHHIDDDD